MQDFATDKFNLFSRLCPKALDSYQAEMRSWPTGFTYDGM